MAQFARIRCSRLVIFHKLPFTRTQRRQGALWELLLLLRKGSAERGGGRKQIHTDLLAHLHTDTNYHYRALLEPDAEANKFVLND